MMKSFLQQHYIWIIFLIMVSLGSLAGELINNRFSMSDLAVYHKTAERLISGEELYRSAEEDPYEHYVYKYSPPAATLFIPFVLIGFPLAKYIYWALLTFILGYCLYTLKKIFLGKEKMNRNITISIILSIAVVGMHFFRELHLGQVNLLLLGIYVVALSSFVNKKSILFGLAVAISLLIKPFGLILMLYMLVLRRFREVMYTFLFAVILIFIPAVFYSNIPDFLALYASWIQELNIELGNKQDLLAAGNHTIFSVLVRFSPLRYIEFSETIKILFQSLVLIAIGALILFYMIKRKLADGHIRVFIILIALIPLLAFTSYNAFIFTLPLILYLLFHFRVLSHPLKILFIISCLLIGGNIYDLVGKDMFDFFWSISVYSWGTIGLIFVIFANWKKIKI